MFTRQQYLDNQCTFEEYYRGIANAAGLKYSKDHPLVKEAAALLAAGAERNLNSIPLKQWDRLSTPPIPWYWASAFKAAGDFATAAGLVCLHKQAVLDAIDAND